MKKRTFLITLVMAACVALVSSCNAKKPQPAKAHYADDDIAENMTAPMKMTESKYEKESKYCKVEVNAEYPASDDAVSTQIRSTLMTYIYKALADDEDNKSIKQYPSDGAKMADAVDYYGKGLYESLLLCSENDHKERQETMKEIAQENGEQYEAPEVMQYYYDIEVDKEWETEDYCVFDVEVETYLGGAHGSSINLGGLTFSKKDGKLFEVFLKPMSEKTLQPLLRKGLVSYFVEEGMTIGDADLDDLLQIEGKIIPLPANGPYPTEKGLMFRYGQYEIAPYAAGKPKVCIPYNEIKPYLTAEAVALLGL